MKRVLLDENDNIVFEGKEAKEIFRILNTSIHDVSEEDEVLYEHIFRPLIGKKLKYEVHFDLIFRGIDDWNRPVFKDKDVNIYFGSTFKLFNWDTPKEEIIKYFKESNETLEYFGNSFGCEPHGGTQEFFKFTFIE